MLELVHRIYTSVQTHDSGPEDVDELIQHSRRNNESHGITGILYLWALPSFRCWRDRLAKWRNSTAQALDEATPEKTEELLAGLDEGRAKRLLRAFGQGRWRARLGLQGKVESQVT